MAAAGRRQLTPGRARLAAPPQLLVAGEGVENVQLVRGAGKPPLLELARHGDQPLAGGAEVLARGRPSPRVRAGAAVGEHAAGDDEPVLLARPQLRQRGDVVLLQEPVG